MVIYILDTNSFLDLPFYYSRDVFPHIWDEFESLVDSRHIISPIHVFNEIGDHHNVLTTWCTNHKFMFQNDDQIYNIAADIMKKFPNLVNTDRRKNAADLYIIALALMNQEESSTDQSIIVTQEKKIKLNPSQKKPISDEQKKQIFKKIPNVAEEYGISSVNLVGFFRNEKWTF